ncbi:MAG: hypothetical protein NT047_06230 [Deltaproteobacteria bacterium]|nr:hypothetical protein [Deltaproteobacteria bacterium]
MNAKITVPLTICILLLLSSCSVAISPKVNSMAENNTPPGESRENENILEAKKLLAEIKEKNSLLALELAKLPELKRTISIKEAESLKNILTLYEIDPLAFDSAFDKMYKEGIPEIRKFCTPLQALFWLSGKVQFSKQNNPLLNYDLESLLNKAWGLHGIVLLEEDVKKILTEPVYILDRKEIKSVLSILSTGPSIFRNKSFLDDVRDKWSNFEEVTNRLNSPRLIFKYVKPNLYYPMTLRFYSGLESPYQRSPEQTFKLKTGNCFMQALFVDYCLKKAGYETVVIQYDCTVGFCGPNPGPEIGTAPTPYHWTVAYKEGGVIYELDAARHYIGGPKTYSEIAGGNPFRFRKSWPGR